MNLFQFVNYNSYGIAAAIVAAWAGWRAARRRTLASLLVFAAVAVALAIPPLWLRAGGSSVPELDVALASGRPTLLEVYSDL
jgi:uncharacterized membrane protein